VNQQLTQEHRLDAVLIRAACAPSIDLPSFLPGTPMKSTLALCVSLALLVASPRAHAGPQADALGQCLVGSTTPADKSLLVKWIFAAMSLNKDVAPYVNLPADVRTQLNRDTAALYTRLLTVSCRTQTHDAFVQEGQPAINTAFQLLGQVASQGLFGDPDVAAGMGDMAQYIDQKAVQDVLDGK
jgi:hypothetical protein